MPEPIENIEQLPEDMRLLLEDANNAITRAKEDLAQQENTRKNERINLWEEKMMRLINALPLELQAYADFNGIDKTGDPEIKYYTPLVIKCAGINPITAILYDWRDRTYVVNYKVETPKGTKTFYKDEHQFALLLARQNYLTEQRRSGETEYVDVPEYA